MTVLTGSLGPVAPAPYELAWYACDLRSGGIIEELRSLKPSQALSRRLGTHTTCSFDLTLAGAPAEWVSATAQGRIMLVAVDTATDIPIWSGVLLTRDGGSAQSLQLGAATLERYLDSRYTGGQTLVQQDQATVVTSLVTPALTYGPPFVIDAPATGVLMDYIVLDSDDRTVLSCLQEIMGAQGGPEWTIDVAWADASHTGFVLPLRVRPAIGSQSPQPEGTFDFPGCISQYSLSESYEQGKGATTILARGEGEGASRLSSSTYEATDLITNGWARWVYRFTPATGITDPNQLNGHAAQALNLMKTGAAVWTAEATASRAPRLGRDWALGDTVRVTVQASPRHPSGVDTVARAWAWELDPAADRVRPILVEGN